MADPLRHRQTKGAATDMVDLTPPRHIPTLPIGGDVNGPFRQRQYGIFVAPRHLRLGKKTIGADAELVERVERHTVPRSRVRVDETEVLTFRIFDFLIR